MTPESRTTLLIVFATVAVFTAGALTGYAIGHSGDEPAPVATSGVRFGATSHGRPGQT